MVGLRQVEHELEVVGECVAHGGWAPGLIRDFDQVEAAHRLSYGLRVRAPGRPIMCQPDAAIFVT